MSIQLIINWKTVAAFGFAAGVCILANKVEPEQVNAALDILSNGFKGFSALSE